MWYKDEIRIRDKFNNAWWQNWKVNVSGWSETETFQTSHHLLNTNNIQTDFQMTQRLAVMLMKIISHDLEGRLWLHAMIIWYYVDVDSGERGLVKNEFVLSPKGKRILITTRLSRYQDIFSWCNLSWGITVSQENWGLNCDQRYIEVCSHIPCPDLLDKAQGHEQALVTT